MMQQDADYDTNAYDINSYKSFRNMLEGFSNPNTASIGK